MSKPAPTDDLNPGIRELVRRLNVAGFDTCDSGDGETHDYECDRDYPYVVIKLSAGQPLVASCQVVSMLVSSWGVRLRPQSLEGTPHIQGTYDPADGSSFIDLCNVTDSMLKEGSERCLSKSASSP